MKSSQKNGIFFSPNFGKTLKNFPKNLRNSAKFGELFTQF